MLSTKKVHDIINDIEQFWARTAQGKRVCGSNSEGEACVFLCEDLHTTLGVFDSEVEAKAYAQAPAHMKELVSLVRTLTKERDEAARILADLSKED